MKRLLLALVVLSFPLTAHKAQAQECISQQKMAIFPRTFTGRHICIDLQYSGLYPLSNRDKIGAGYRTNFARITARDSSGRFYNWLLVPVKAFDKVSQLKQGDIITVYGHVVRVTEFAPGPFYTVRPQPIIEVNRIDHGGERLQLDLKLKGRK